MTDFQCYFVVDVDFLKLSMQGFLKWYNLLYN